LEAKNKKLDEYVLPDQIKLELNISTEDPRLRGIESFFD